MGRPAKLKPDEKTLGIVNSLGQIQCTQKEIAAVLKVSLATFENFLRAHKRAREALETGQQEGRTSLRRTQLRLAHTNAGMAIFLGKNILGQTDQVDHAVSGSVQHNVSIELQHLLQAVDGQSRALPKRLELLPGPRVETGSPLQNSRPNGSNGHVQEK